MVNHLYGEIFKQIRTQKKISLSQFQKLGIDKGTISRFERGESMMGLERIDVMLLEMNVSLAEYELILNHFVSDYHEEFFQELEQADIQKNSKKLTLLYEEARSYGYKWLSYAVKARQEKLNFSEKLEVTNFLEEVTVWGYFELSVAYFVLDNLETDMLLQIMGQFANNDKNYLGIFKYRRRIFQIAYRAVVIFVSREEPEQAKLIIDKTSTRRLEIIDFYIENLRQMAVGIYEYRFGELSKGERQIAQVLETFERLGYKELRTFYEERNQSIFQKTL